MQANVWDVAKFSAIVWTTEEMIGGRNDSGHQDDDTDIPNEYSSDLSDAAGGDKHSQQVLRALCLRSLCSTSRAGNGIILFSCFADCHNGITAGLSSLAARGRPAIRCESRRWTGSDIYFPKRPGSVLRYRFCIVHRLC